MHIQNEDLEKATQAIEDILRQAAEPRKTEGLKYGSISAICYEGPIGNITAPKKKAQARQSSKHTLKNENNTRS
ncbi:hypothetical protein ANN_06819 [Periplaneta americana]|uniref:Uncharacterized protein n=1 Tax=Periplaneta americana TaxID=6978 RepID=A0ABQ8TH49_PERAM|nr:hypothetical protein ANN_06819 [Periplaneta americana]